jgi:hypothetical protein
LSKKKINCKINCEKWGFKIFIIVFSCEEDRGKGRETYEKLYNSVFIVESKTEGGKEADGGAVQTKNKNKTFFQ